MQKRQPRQRRKARLRAVATELGGFGVTRSNPSPEDLRRLGDAAMDCLGARRRSGQIGRASAQGRYSGCHGRTAPCGHEGESAERDPPDASGDADHGDARRRRDHQYLDLRGVRIGPVISGTGDLPRRACGLCQTICRTTCRAEHSNERRAARFHQKPARDARASGPYPHEAPWQDPRACLADGVAWVASIIQIRGHVAWMPRDLHVLVIGMPAPAAQPPLRACCRCRASAQKRSSSISSARAVGAMPASCNRVSISGCRPRSEARSILRR